MQTTTITLTMEQYNELEGVISMLTLVGIMTDSRKNNHKMLKHTKNCMIRLILQTLSIIGGAND